MGTYDEILNGSGAAARPQQTTAPVASGEAAGGGGATATTITKTATSTAASVPVVDEDDVPVTDYAGLWRRFNPDKPPTKAQVEAEERKHRRNSTFAAIGDGIAAMSNLYFTSQYAPNAYDGAGSMSGRMRERWEKLQADRAGRTRAYLDGLMRATAMDDAGRKDARSWRHQLRIEQEQREERAAARAYQKERDAKADERAADALQYQKERDAKADERDERDFNEGKRRYDEGMKLSRAQFAATLSSQGHRVDKEETTFVLGPGRGTATIPNTRINGQTVAYLFSTLPEDVRTKVAGKPVKVKKPVMYGDVPTGKYEEVLEYPNSPSEKDMLLAIGANIAGSPDTQRAVCELAGKVWVDYNPAGAVQAAGNNGNNKGKGY